MPVQREHGHRVEARDSRPREAPARDFRDPVELVLFPDREEVGRVLQAVVALRNATEVARCVMPEASRPALESADTTKTVVYRYDLLRARVKPGIALRRWKKKRKLLL